MECPAKVITVGAHQNLVLVHIIVAQNDGNDDMTPTVLICEGRYKDQFMELLRIQEQERKNMEYPYYFAWKNNSKRVTLYKRHCRVLARGAKNSCQVEFENGQREIISRNALRRLK